MIKSSRRWAGHVAKTRAYSGGKTRMKDTIKEDKDTGGLIILKWILER
jgi:hypothetical protein